jgi:hypothetical protein
MVNSSTNKKSWSYSNKKSMKSKDMICSCMAGVEYCQVNQFGWLILLPRFDIIQQLVVFETAQYLYAKVEVPMAKGLYCCLSSRELACKSGQAEGWVTRDLP